MSDSKLALIKQMLTNAQRNLDQATSLLAEIGEGAEELTAAKAPFINRNLQIEESDLGKIIEGVFDGESMIGPDGRQYQVPVNYASKSKLVEGDILKLTIKPDGTFIYKPINPIERKRVTGDLVKDEENGEFRVLCENKLYKVLLASITYFKGRIGDSVVVLVPSDGNSNWAAVENIIPKEMNLDVNGVKTVQSETEVDDLGLDDVFLKSELELT